MYTVKRLPIYAALFFALILQMTVLNYLRIFGAAPDLLLITVIFFGLFFGAGAGLESGIIAGILKDVFALDFFGINMFICALTGLLAGALNTKFSREAKSTQFVLTLSFTAFSMISRILLASVFSRFHMLYFWEYIFASVLPVSLYTAAVSIPVFARFIAIFNLRTREEFI